MSISGASYVVRLLWNNQVRRVCEIANSSCSKKLFSGASGLATAGKIAGAGDPPQLSKLVLISHRPKATRDPIFPATLSPVPPGNVVSPAAKPGSRPNTATGCQAHHVPRRGTHFHKRFRLSGLGANPATNCLVLHRFRSYCRMDQTLLAESPPL